MQTKLKFKRNERGQVIESLTTGVFGLVFISKITYDYDEEGHLISETTWKDMKTVKSVKHLLPALVSKD